MTKPNQLTPAIALAPAKKGEKVSVRLPNGQVKRLTANNDIISTNVLVIGDRVLSNDVSRSQLKRNTELFQSKTTPVEEGELPWAYLFEINDFTAYENEEGIEIRYTDESWNLDLITGTYKPFGDGGGDYKTQEELIDFYSQNDLDGDPRFNQTLEQHSNVINISRLASQSIDVQYQGTNPNNSFSRLVDSDGLAFGNTLLFLIAENERLRTLNFPRRNLYPERNYWVKETFLGENYTRIWDTFTGAIYQSLTITGNSQGEINRTYIYESRTYSSPTRYTFRRLITYIVDNSGTETVSFSPAVNSSSQREDLRQRARDTINAFNSAGYEEITFDIPDLIFNRQILTGQQIIDGVASREYRLNSGFLPQSFEVNGERFDLGFSNNRQDITIYKCSVFLVPEVSKRNPGIKSIYAQVRDNRKVLIHQIPSFENYDGSISPLNNGKLEVVLKCGKQFPSDRSLSNSNLRIFFDPNTTISDRDYAQVRVYILDDTGKIISTKIYNNALTDLNPSEIADEIEISASNWQKEWISNYENRHKNTTFFIVEILDSFNYIDGDLRNRFGAINNLTSGYRSYYSDRVTDYLKAIPETQVARTLIYYSSYGTLTRQGFVYLEPKDLFDINIELDYSFSFFSNFFPSANYSIFSSLYNSAQTNKRYFLTTGTYQNDTFTPGISIEKATQFPKLDLKNEVAEGVVIPAEITSADWQTEWSKEQSVQTNLLRFGLKAIAFLG